MYIVYILFCIAWSCIAPFHIAVLVLYRIVLNCIALRYYNMLCCMPISVGIPGLNFQLKSSKLRHFLPNFSRTHYTDAIMSAKAFQITCDCLHSRKHRSSGSLAFVRGIHRWPVKSPSQRASNAENVSIWWRHHAFRAVTTTFSALTWPFSFLGSFWSMQRAFWSLDLGRVRVYLVKYAHSVMMDHSTVIEPINFAIPRLNFYIKVVK